MYRPRPSPALSAGLGLLACLLVVAPLVEAQSTYEQGVAYFEQGRFAEALSAFEDVLQTQGHNARLDYNIGSTYYRLGRLEEARTAFLAAAGAPEFASLAHYNLGLIAMRQDRREDARQWFKQALAESDDPRIQRLCRAALDRLEPAKPQAVAASAVWSGLLDFDIAYDDNVTLQPDTLILSASRKDDLFADIYGFASRRLGGNGELGWQIEGSLFAQKYARLSRFDTFSFGIGATLDHPYGWDIRGRTGLRSELTWLDNRGFTATMALTTEGKRRFSTHGRLRLRYELAHIDVLDTPYAYLAGWRQRIEIRPRWHWAGLRIDLAYRYEDNDRKDRSSPLFQSFSARRHRFMLKAAKSFADVYEFEAAAYYRESRYRDPNALSTGGEITRSEDRLRSRLSLNRRLGHEKDVSLSYEYTSNDSNITRYAYESNQYMLSLFMAW